MKESLVAERSGIKPVSSLNGRELQNRGIRVRMSISRDFRWHF